MFERATKDKLRFDTNFGNITVEDLWDLPLTDSMSTSLDDVAKGLNKKIKENGDESFVTKKSTGSGVIELKFDIVKHIIAVRLEEIKKVENALIVKAKKEKILSIIATKEDESLGAVSVEDLKTMLAEL